MTGAVATIEKGSDLPPKRGRKKLVLLAAPVLLLGAGAGLWFGGILPPLLGMGPRHGEPGPGGKPEEKAAAAEPARKLVFADMPEIVANLNAGPRRTMFIKLQAKLELARAEDQPAVSQAMPRLLDLFQTYLREMRPEELRGAEGSYRLREELIARASVAVAPVAVNDVLFTGMLIQ